MDADGVQTGEGEQGRIQIAGPCVTRSYFNATEDPQAQGWLDTGDLGFVHQDEVYITGRGKDVIIHNGTNVHAHEIEEAVVRTVGELAQRAVAFSVPRQEDLRDEVVVAVELRKLPAPNTFPADVRSAVLKELGVQVDHVLALPRSAIPRTTSGKVQRGRARELYRAGQLQLGGTSTDG